MRCITDIAAGGSAGLSAVPARAAVNRSNILIGRGLARARGAIAVGHP